MAGKNSPFPLLDNIGSVFTNRDIERRKQLEIIKAKEECNKVHVQYLKENVISKQDYARAGSVVSEWAKRNGNVSKEASRLLRNKRTTDLIPLSRETIKRRRLANSPSHHRSQALEQSSHQNLDHLETSVVCEVVNCGIVFDSKLEFERHNASFKHSPCNPYKHLPNGRLLSFPLLHTCPKCTAQFKKKVDCQEHMIFKDHLPVLSPVAVYGYMCPQCCMIFHNIVQCHTHMSQNNHYSVTYSFSQDTGEESSTTKSILISDYLAKLFYTKCLSKDYTVKCMTCKREVSDVLSKHKHTLSTGHQEYSTYSTSLTDEVFGEFLSDKSCDNCGKIIWNGDIEKGFHACTSTEIGFLKDNDSATFREFVHRCGIQDHVSCNFDEPVQNVDDYQRLGASSSNAVSIANSPLGAVGGSEPVNESEVSVILLDTPDVGSAGTEKFQYDSDASSIILDTPPVSSQKSSNVRTESVIIVEKPIMGNVGLSNIENNQPVQPNEEDDMSIGISSGHDVVQSNEEDDMSLDDETDYDSVHSNDLDYMSIGDSDNSDIVFTGAEESKPSVSNWVLNSKPDQVSTSRTVTRSMSPTKKVIQISKQLTESSTFSYSNDPAPATEAKAVVSPNDKNVFSNAHEPELKKLSKKARYRRKKKLEKEKLLLLENEQQSDSKPSTSNVSPAGALQYRDRSRSRSRSRSISPHKPSGNDLHNISKNHLPILQQKKSLRNTRGPDSYLRNFPRGSFEDGDISTENLSKMHLLIFLDLDNWTGFFKRLPQCLPDKTFVWTFYGGNTLWKEPKALAFLKLKKDGCFYLHSQCGKTKDAADFAICFTIGKMDDRLPKHVPFAILSGDRGFCEIENQMRNSSRRTVVIDPHEAVKSSEHMLYTMILSVMNS